MNKEVMQMWGVTPHNIKEKCDGCADKQHCMMTTFMRLLCESPRKGEEDEK